MESRRRLARRLEGVVDFETPTVALEQYLTPAELAAHICHLAALRGDLADRLVVDLGTGTGMLAIASACGTPARVVGIDIDRTALEEARENERRVAPPMSIEWVQADGTRAPLSTADQPITVVSNPPFGAQHGNRHADRAFLETAADLGGVSYTIHNEGSLAFLESFAADAGGTLTDAFRAPIELERRFAFHEDDRRELQVEVVRIEWS